MKYFILALTLLTAPAAQARPVLLELFTSLGCSSCPPADTLLAKLAKNPAILPLSFNITYWNNLGYIDPYGLTAATDRQSWYATLTSSQEVFTPEAIIDGGPQLVGSNEGDITRAIDHAIANQTDNIPLTITNGPMITITTAAGPGPATLWLFGYDSKTSTAIPSGENAGNTITETNLVRSITNLGTWTGTQTSMTIPHPAGQHVAIILQTSTGSVLGAAAE
jgi:hypothetical protein